MKAIITGAAGFAGYSVTRELLKKGYEVFAILRPASSHNARFKVKEEQLHLLEVSGENFDEIPRLIDVECDVFYHLAWGGDRDDFEVQNANIGYTMKALEAAVALGCKRFIGIGSQAEYGVCEGMMTENDMPSPINAYGAAKVAAMYLSKRRAEQLSIEWIWGRIFSLYGDYEPAGRMLPDLLRKLISGDDISLSSCEQNWDYLHVRDAAKLIVLLGEKGYSGEIYNIANGNYKSLKSFVAEAAMELSSTSVIHFGKRANPFISLQPDVTKAKEHTGFVPGIPFAEGIRQFINEDLT